MVLRVENVDCGKQQSGMGRNQELLGEPSFLVKVLQCYWIFNLYLYCHLHTHKCSEIQQIKAKHKCLYCSKAS